MWATEEMSKAKKTIKFHGLAVNNVVVRYYRREINEPNTIKMEEFDAAKDPNFCENVNIQTRFLKAHSMLNGIVKKMS